MYLPNVKKKHKIHKMLRNYKKKLKQTDYDKVTLKPYQAQNNIIPIGLINKIHRPNFLRIKLY